MFTQYAQQGPARGELRLLLKGTIQTAKQRDREKGTNCSRRMDVNLLKDQILLGSLIDKRMGWAEHVAYLGNKGNENSVLERKP
jgi:hypothetical protein